MPQIVETGIDACSLPGLAPAPPGTVVEPRGTVNAITARVNNHRSLGTHHPATAEAAVRANLHTWEIVDQILGDYHRLIAEYRRQIRHDNGIDRRYNVRQGCWRVLVGPD